MGLKSEINIIGDQNNYPSVYLPEILINHILYELDFEELVEGSGKSFLNKVEKAKRKSSFDDLLLGKIPERHEIPLEEIKLLNGDSIHYLLESTDFYCLGQKLPRKPKLYETQSFKIKDYSDLKSWIFFSIIISLFMSILIGAIFIPALLTILNTTYWILNLALYLIFQIIILSRIYYHSIRGESFEKTKSKNIFKYSKLEREEMISKYKNTVFEIFDSVNKKIEVKNKKLKKWIHENQLTIENKIISNNLKNSSLGIFHVLNTNKGVSELEFFKLLYLEFGSKVKIDVAPIMKNPFLPDLVIYDENLGLYIDIEIDEPYSFGSNEIIHHDRSNDNERNDFFTSNNWIVIRFSEKQVVKFPNECMFFVKDVIYSIFNKESIVIFHSNIDPHWTYEDAIYMRLNSYRENYLNGY